MIKEKLDGLFNKNKNMQTLCIILIIGIVIIIFANSAFSKSSQKKQNANNSLSPGVVDYSLQNELEQILSKIRGAGRVSVMITYEGTGEKHYAADITSESSNSGSGEQNIRTQTQSKHSSKLVTSSKEPVITKESFPKVMGVIVVCDGGDNMQVKADIINALKAVLNVADHKISVFAQK